MKFSIFSLMQWPEGGNDRDIFADELDQLTRAESQGYHCAWLAEHPLSRFGIGPAIHLTAANLAARTHSIRIGTAITILPFMHPLRVAEEVAMLDVLSEGRIEWGVGRGSAQNVGDGNDDDATKEDQVFREQLEVIELAWTGAPFSHHGEFYDFDELQCFPHPVQQPAPQIHISAPDASSVEWVAKQRYRMLADSLVPADRLATDRALYLDTLAAAGVDTHDLTIPTLRHVYVGESMAKAREEAAAALLSHHRALGRVETPTNATQDPESFLKFLFDECTIVGDAAGCRDRIAELRETAGLDHVVCWQNFGDLDHEQALASQQRLIEDVVPAFA